jgi:organic radical activating enzyme
MKNKIILPFLEIMPTQVCNFSCDGCTNYSDMIQKGYLSWHEGKAQIEPWLDRLTIPDFGIIGGEPLLVPDIIDWIYGLRELMPESQIRFTTNGTYLSKYPDLLKVFFDIGNCVFKISLHADNLEIEKFIEENLSRYRWNLVTEFGIQRYLSDNNVRFQINRPQKFVKTYIGSGYHDMRPHNNNPVEAFDICIQKTCPLIYQSRIYKCSTSGLLKDLLDKVNTPYRYQWDPYITDGIGIDSPVEDIVKFVDSFGKPESICRMCPTDKDKHSQIIHYNNIGTKKKI